MKRRDFLALPGGTASWPLVAHAQQADRVRRIGVLMGYPADDKQGQTFVAAFREGLQTLRWMQGRNIRIETRWASPGDPAVKSRFTFCLRQARVPLRRCNHGMPQGRDRALEIRGDRARERGRADQALAVVGERRAQKCKV
jgi:hypothetical protein